MGKPVAMEQGLIVQPKGFLSSHCLSYWPTVFQCGLVVLPICQNNTSPGHTLCLQLRVQLHTLPMAQSKQPCSPHTYREANRQTERPADIQRQIDPHTQAEEKCHGGTFLAWVRSIWSTKTTVRGNLIWKDHGSLAHHPFTTVASLGHRCSAVGKREATFDTLEHIIKRQMKYHRNNNAADSNTTLYRPVETVDCRPLPRSSHDVLRAPCNNYKHIHRSLQVSSAKGISWWK